MTVGRGGPFRRSLPTSSTGGWGGRRTTVSGPTTEDRGCSSRPSPTRRASLAGAGVTDGDEPGRDRSTGRSSPTVIGRGAGHGRRRVSGPAEVGSCPSGRGTSPSAKNGGVSCSTGRGRDGRLTPGRPASPSAPTTGPSLVYTRRRRSGVCVV